MKVTTHKLLDAAMFEAIAKIALAMPEGQITQRALLNALVDAYEAGFEAAATHKTERLGDV